MMDPKDQAKSRQVFEENRQLTDEAINQCELRIKTKEEDYRWFLIIDTPFKRDANGELTQVLSTFHDITEQKAREYQLWEQQQFITAITENTPSFINIYDFDKGAFIYENRSILRYLGYEPPFGASRYPYFHPDDRQRIADCNQANLHLSDGEISTIEYRMQHKDGHYRWFYNQDVVHKRDEAGNIRQVLRLIADVTETKETEVSLRRSEAYYRQLFQNTPVGIVTLDLDYRLVSCNAGFTALFGYTQADLKGRILDEFIVPDGYRDEAENLCNEPLYGEATSRETTRVDKDGNAIPVLVYGVPIFFDGEPVNLYGMYIDLSERQKAEDDLRQQTQALLRSNAELEQFAYITSHHLRSPIINLQSLLDLFDTQELRDPENQYIFQKLTESSDELSHTLNDLTYIVGRKEQLSKPKELVSFQQVLNEVTAQLKPAIDQTEAQLLTDFREAPQIRYLKTFLTSICYHLLSNALHFRHPDRAPRIHIQTTRYHGDICLSITDNGLGIDLEKDGHRIFELYQGAHAGSSGKGMGLYLVKYQVEALGGSILVDSEVGYRTTFNIYLRNFDPDGGS
jgi:PAS domain S-box-containing protein